MTVTPAGLTGVSVTYDGSPTAPTNAGSYAILATVDNDDYEAPAHRYPGDEKAAQTIAFTQPADQTFGDAPFVLSATGGASGNLVVFASTTPGTCSVERHHGDDSARRLLHHQRQPGGKRRLRGGPRGEPEPHDQQGAGHPGAEHLTYMYDATPKSATVTTTPSGLAGVSVTYDGSATAPTNAGSYAVVATLTNQDYAGARRLGDAGDQQGPAHRSLPRTRRTSMAIRRWRSP